MENINTETTNPVGTSPIPDLFNTEPAVLNTADECSEVKTDDASACTNTDKSGDDFNADESVSAASETENPESTKVLLDGIAALGGQIQSLEKLFATKIMHSEHEKKIVDQMHRELQKYKDDMYAQILRPILLDIIAMRDSILKQLKEHRNKPDGEQHIPLQMFETYAFDTDEILEKNSIEIYKSDANSDFEPMRQRAIKKIQTDDQSLHGKVAESLIDGYNYQNKTISPEKVAVYVYEPKQQDEENTGEAFQNG